MHRAAASAMCSSRRSSHSNAATAMCSSRRSSHSNKNMYKLLACIDAFEQQNNFVSRDNVGTGRKTALSFQNNLCRCTCGHQHDLKRLFPGFAACNQLSDHYMVLQRKFSSRSNPGDENNEDGFDDFESRLIKEEYEGDDMNMDDSSYARGGVKFDDYNEWNEDENVVDIGGDDSVEVPSKDVVDNVSDSDADNEQSDEEFEGERTDEELDELLANTPLFEPPDVPEFVRPNEPLPEFSFRPEGPVFYPGMEYDPEELDVTRPLKPRKREERPKPEISVKEVIDKADFKNVNYLTRFIEETGTIRPRREFKMRKKSHNRIVKAIKTARFFGLMPYSNMGRPRYIFNKPFDEFAEFYETDEDEKVKAAAQSGATDRSIFGNRGLRRDNLKERPGRISGPTRWRR